jgi:hypothetical protein
MDDVSKPANDSEQSGSFQYMQEHVARSMANFYAAYRPRQKSAAGESTTEQAKRGDEQAKAKVKS